MSAGDISVGVNRGFELTAEPATVRKLLGDVWRSRELVFMLARKDFFVRFRRTSFGLLWSILLPIVQASLMAGVLSRFVRFDTDIGYAAFIYSGTIAFNFLSTGMVGGVGSLVDNHGLSTKIYFPRLVFPLVIVGAGFYNLVPGLFVMVGMAWMLGDAPTFALLWLVPAVAVLCVFTASVGAVLSVLQVYARDVRYIVQAAVQPLFYVTPVLYPLTAVDNVRDILVFNPATGVVELFRAALGGADPGWGSAVLSTLVWTTALAVVAIVLYRRYDRVAVDLL